MGAAAKKKKSGLLTLKPGERLFNDNDPADSLYIIQQGQVRLFKPKGKGFIELAVLRNGEVLGEMAFFDDQGGRRSCSAEAMVETSVIEVSFQAFGKAIENLNPWFKTIITTLAERLRRTNAKVKELESNSMTGGYGSQSREYTFLRNADVVKILATFFLVFKSHGEVQEKAYSLHRQAFNLYAEDIFNQQEVKIEAFIGLLKDLGYLSVSEDQNGAPKLLNLIHLDRLKEILFFFNNERNTVDDKRLLISHRCEAFLAEIIHYIDDKELSGDSLAIPLKPILQKFREQKVVMDEDDLSDAIKAGLLEDPVVGKNNDITTVVHVAKLNKVFYSIQFMNAVKKLNESK